MARKRLLWQLFPSYLLITTLALIAVTWYATNTLQTVYLELLEADLHSRAMMAKAGFEERGAPMDPETADALCKTYGRILNARVTLILPGGEVLGESERSPESMENHSNRPEIQDALEEGSGASIRFSNTLDKNMMYYALPLTRNGEAVGVIRTSIPATAIDNALRMIYHRVVLGGLVVAVIAAVISLAVSRRISLPLETLKLGAERFARGDLKSQLAVPDSEEIGRLAEAMNQMAEQLDDRIRTIMQQRNEKEAILSSMIEGVIAVDGKLRVISLNQAASKLLGLGDGQFEGRPAGEVIENEELYNFIAQTLKSRKNLERELTLNDPDKRFMQAHGSPLSDSDGNQIGSVVVLHDVTRIRKLESIRRDFVANVSHELKTPITSIKGSVETLIDGAMENRADAMRFLSIIAKQSDRLHAIIEDLLSLSRIEQEEGVHRIPLESASIEQLLQSAADCCKSKAAEKNVTLEIGCPSGLAANINPPLLEQAVVNLIDNAIKYSPEGGKVFVGAETNGKGLELSVRDQGCGIEPEHQPRIFERFYRVDKARSRKLGGTGLGLAIVKHISQAHGGAVRVESKPGEGSRFVISVPA